MLTAGGPTGALYWLVELVCYCKILVLFSNFTPKEQKRKWQNEKLKIPRDQRPGETKRFEAFWAFQKNVLGGSDGAAAPAVQDSQAAH
jgi:hypothetical protein